MMRKQLFLRIAMTAATLTGLSQISPASASFLNVSSAIDSFHTYDDNMQHAIIADSAGNVKEVYWRNPNTPSVAFLASFSGITSVAAYWTPFDGYRHAIVALTNASTGNVEIHEIYYGTPGIFQDVLLTFSASVWGTVVGLAGFMSSDNVEHVVFALSKGTVWDYRFDSYAGSPVERQIGTFGIGTIIDVAAYQAHDGYYHAIVATSASSLSEIYYKDTLAPAQDLLTASLANPVVSIGAQDSWVHGPNANAVSVGLNNGFFEYFDYGNGTSGVDYVTQTPHSELIQSVASVGQNSISGFEPTGVDMIVASTAGHLYECLPSSTIPNHQDCYQLNVAF